MPPAGFIQTSSKYSCASFMSASGSDHPGRLVGSHYGSFRRVLGTVGSRQRNGASVIGAVACLSSTRLQVAKRGPWVRRAEQVGSTA
jgi:hypothetical protein